LVSAFDTTLNTAQDVTSYKGPEAGAKEWWFLIVALAVAVSFLYLHPPTDGDLLLLFREIVRFLTKFPGTKGSEIPNFCRPVDEEC